MKMIVQPPDHVYGWIPDIPDPRDFPYARLAVALPKLPPSVDLRQYCSGIENQGTIGSCTAHALVGNMEFLKKRMKKTMIQFSRLFVYYNEREIEGTADRDSGAMLRDGIKSLAHMGDCPESVWPYDQSKYTVKPPEDAYTAALDHQITSYYRLSGMTEMKHTLSMGYPFVFGFSVYLSMETPEVRKTGVIPMPSVSDTHMGGHAVMAVGYDDEKQMFLFRNSWGVHWGEKGYGYIPYAYVTDPSLSADFWTIRGME